MLTVKEMTEAHRPGPIWGCKIGVIGDRPLPRGCDAPMRNAVQAAFRNVVGEDAEFTFSGWSETLTEPEAAVVENRPLDPEYYAAEQLRDAAPDLLEALRGCLPYIRDMDDEGPAGEGWQSERLSRLIAEADAAILKATATEQGERG